MAQSVLAKDEKPFERKKNSFNLEVFGSAFFYSIQYENIFFDNFLFNIGLTVLPGNYYLHHVVEIASPFSLQYSIPIKNWGIDMGPGLLWVYTNSIVPWFQPKYAFLHLGVRFYPVEHLLLKIYWNPEYNLYFPSSASFTNRILPFIFGLSVGYAF